MIINREDPLSIKDLKIDGHDLERLGLLKGRVYGELLEKALDLVLEFPEKNNKDELIEFVKGKIS